MSSDSPGPYKSRLFNFLNRKSIDWQDRLGQTWRNAKLAAVWGVQVLFYPIYLLVQTGRLTGYELKQSIGRAWKQLQPATSSLPEEIFPAADTPIQRVLQALNTSDIGNRLALPSTSPTPPEFSLTRQVIVGLASLLTTRSLVLVTTENQIVDILTPEEEQKLRQRLIWEIAAYWHHWRSWYASGRKFSRRVPTKERSRALLPIRWFWEAIAWMQTSPVAITVNLFGESTLVPSFTDEPTTTELTARTPYSLDLFEQQLALLDDRIAQWESNPIFPRYRQGWQRVKELLQQLRAKIAGEISLADDSAAPPQTPETDDMKIQALIWAAIDHFFGNKRQRKRLSANPRSNSVDRVPPASKKVYDSLPPDLRFDEEDPWLSWEDLFPDAPTETPKNRQKPSENSADDIAISGTSVPDRTKLSAKASPVELSGQPPLAELPGEANVKPALPGKQIVPFWQSIGRAIRSFLGLPVKDAKGLSKRQAQSIANTAKIPPLVTDAKGELAHPVTPNSAIEHTPDWVETEATPVGYIKHPLERVLQWLDRAMLWLEETTIAIWQWVKRRRK
ncbi:MAG: hypothetical protein KME17_15755 [Cyanosarcina radialis HA8281-LM2]|jgi:hypothetical protein|nr:hypothetical protein [Cyanosarcina radialis HA8281-LM2]